MTRPKNTLRPLKSLKLADWPDEDQSLWAALVRTGDIFEDQGKAAHWSQSYQDNVVQSYGRWLQFLSLNHPEELSLPAQHRIRPETVRDYIEQLRTEVSSETVRIYVSRLFELAKVITRQLEPGISPSEHWDWLDQLQKDLKARAKTKNKRPRMVDAERLYQLGHTLMAKAEVAFLNSDRSVPSKNEALNYRDGLMIALLAARPIRRKNMAQIEIGEHLTRHGDLYHLAFEAEDVKNRHDLAFAVPNDLTPYIDTYLETYRPAFGGSDTHAGLWASVKGGPLCGKAIYDVTKRHTERAFGKSVNPHLFRDCAATTIAINASSQVLIAKDVLAHSDFETTEKYYIQAQSLEASRQYQSIVLALRQESSNTSHHKRS